MFSKSPLTLEEAASNNPPPFFNVGKSFYLQHHNLLPEKESKNMENKKLAAPVIVLLCIITTMSVMAPKGLATAQIAADPATISMTPVNGTSVQGLFNVTIMLSGSTTSSIGGANIYITFDDNIVNATRWFVPTADPTFFMPTTPTPTLVPTPPDPGYRHDSPGNAHIQCSCGDRYR